MPNSEFKQLLKEGIDSVANRQGKKVSIVEEEIGQVLCVSPHTVQRWKRGYVPNDLQRLEFLTSYCQQHGRVDRSWGRRFLTQAGYPGPEAVLDRLFPAGASPTSAGDHELPRVCHNLPPRYGEFIGREAEVARVLEWVETSRWPLASIEGMGGIGKTSLAIEVAHRCLPGPQLAIAKPFQAVVWTSARDYADFNLRLDHVLDTIARVLDYPHLAQLPPEQKVGAIDKLLRSQRTLVLADNLETVTDLALVKFLEQIPEPSLALVTTRYKQLRRVWDIPLYGLKDKEILTLIRRHSQRINLQMVAGADDDTLQRLAAASGNNPKAVELSLGLIKQKGLPFNTVVDELYQASQMVKEVFDYIFAEAWKLLDDDTKQVLLAMSLFVSSASRAALSAVAQVEEFDFFKAIEELVGMSLLEASEALDINQQRYWLHPLTQIFARRQLGVDPSLNVLRGHNGVDSKKIFELKSNFCTFFAAWSEKKAGHNFWDFASWNAEQYAEIHLELPNLVIAQEWAYENKNWTQVLALAKAVVHPVYYQGHPDKRLKCSEYALTAAKKLGQREDEMWFAIHGLGSIYLLRGDYATTEKYLNHGLEVAREINLLDGLALGYTYIAYKALQMDNLAEAQKNVALALDCAQGSLFKYRAHQAAGHVARYTHNYDQAKAYYLKGIEYLNGTSYRDPSAEVWLGFAELGLTHNEQAVAHFRHYLEAHGKYGNHRVVAMAKLGLALYYEVQGQLQQSADLAHEAFDLLANMNAQWELKQVRALIERLPE
jgi:LuxR family glucitol operon transcriptional activator